MSSKRKRPDPISLDDLERARGGSTSSSLWQGGLKQLGELFKHSMHADAGATAGIWATLVEAVRSTDAGVLAHVPAHDLQRDHAGAASSHIVTHADSAQAHVVTQPGAHVEHPSASTSHPSASTSHPSATTSHAPYATANHALSPHPAAAPHRAAGGSAPPIPVQHLSDRPYQVHQPAGPMHSAPIVHPYTNQELHAHDPFIPKEKTEYRAGIEGTPEAPAPDAPTDQPTTPEPSTPDAPVDLAPTPQQPTDAAFDLAPTPQPSPSFDMMDFSPPTYTPPDIPTYEVSTLDTTANTYQSPFDATPSLTPETNSLSFDPYNNNDGGVFDTPGGLGGLGSSFDTSTTDGGGDSGGSMSGGGD